MSSTVYPWDCFQTPAELDPRLCFILSPFRTEFAGPKQIIEEVCAELGFRCIRADDLAHAGIIHADIWQHVHRAGIIVADITTLNPNVILEVGVTAAIKESFRLVLMIREGTTATMPFDLAPFRHIPYEDSLTGSRVLRDRLRDAFSYAMSEAGVLSSLTARMQEWERSGHDYTLLVSPETLARMKGFGGIKDAASDVRSYLLAASVQHGSQVEHWSILNRENVEAAEVLVELLVGPWVRPQFRAAFALQFLDDRIRALAVREARALGTTELVRMLVDAVESKGVAALLEQSHSQLLTEADRYELLHNFKPRVNVKLPRRLP